MLKRLSYNKMLAKKKKKTAQDYQQAQNYQG